ncbi:glycoside hydrolase family 2 TIM barrel-domain containing protein [Draconibacterium sp. IB214405]|uniref:glycoside hydrolase family 2 protein n=1 Tax=Draconibacterium sp. IB214405 TaxID=3097352 RepID=UPI002A177440|nr:glycoside hydrolase family 2 TIM barrel-domain containing protein [Draconibacterium sp. IB214405]MDX8339383.1 glycoside hydrolase family 2 TIM barrel-domain containing protein [Draconibacterium sp. IB214405]
MIRTHSTLTILLLSLLIFTGQAQPVIKQVKYLSGTDNENTVTWDFFCTAGRNSGEWSKIQVPSHWEQQGFGQYDYGRDYRTYGKKFIFSDETGIYKHNFTIPKNWNDNEIFIVFEGSMTDTEVKINGELAGPIHQGAFYQFRYNITDKLKAGENELEVTVHKNSANQSVNRAERYADYWIFGGIFRPVYLEAFPASYIERVAIDAAADGSFRMDVFPVNTQKKQSIYAEIFDADGNVVKTCESDINPKDSLVTLNCKVDNPATWTAETPNRYSVKVSLKEGTTTKYALSEKFGFRTIEIREGDGIYLNGVKIKMKGINRHVFWPETGRCSNARIDLNDVKLMKEMNLNAVRCAHYPPDKSFLNFCDSLGLYVLDELAGWQNAYDTESGEKLVREMVIRDVNHPSIILWSNGNEGGTNKELDDDYDIYDPSKRPVIHAHHRPGNDYNGIDCNHYENYYSSKKILDGDLIFMPTEFLHAQDDGGAAASLADFWELFWNSEKGAGGFIWNFSDEGIVRTDLNNVIDVNRVNAPDGVLGPHREKEGSYYALREIYSSVKVDLQKLPTDFDGTIPVENRFHFTNLNKCTFSWKLVNFVDPEAHGTGYTVMENGNVTAPDIAPVSKGELKLNLPSDYKKYDGLYLYAFDQHGEEIYCWSWKTNGNRKEVLKLVEKTLSDEEKTLLEELKAQGIEEDNILPIQHQEGDDSGLSAKVELTEDDEQITLKASGIGVSFSKTDGVILKVTNDFGLPIPFTNGPVLVSGNAELKDISHHEKDGAYVVEMTYDGDIQKLQWTMYPSGWLELNYSYQVADKQLFTGISFEYPESDIISAKWLGEGPAHVWKNRLQGGQLDVYERLYNNILPATNSWGEQFKGYYANINWMEFNTVDGKFTVVAQEPDLFVRLFDFYGISGPQNYPELPVGNISFLDGIPPVGTKLAMGISNDTWNLGPSGELNVMEKPVERTLYFYFGLRQ